MIFGQKRMRKGVLFNKGKTEAEMYCHGMAKYNYKPDILKENERTDDGKIRSYRYRNKLE